MIFRQVLGDRLPLAVYEQKAVTVFVNFHVIARADPRPVQELFSWVRIEPTGAQWAPKYIEVAREP